MRCSADRRERRGARSNSSQVGNGTACAASCRRAFGNKATSCVRSGAPGNACTGSKAELVAEGVERAVRGNGPLSLACCLIPNGLEERGLLTPVEHGEDVPDVFDEEAVRCRAELGKKEQLLLNRGSEIGEQQNSRQTAPAETGQRREL